MSDYVHNFHKRYCCSQVTFSDKSLLRHLTDTLFVSDRRVATGPIGGT